MTWLPYRRDMATFSVTTWLPFCHDMATFSVTAGHPLSHNTTASRRSQHATLSAMTCCCTIPTGPIHPEAPHLFPHSTWHSLSSTGNHDCLMAAPCHPPVNPLLNFLSCDGSLSVTTWLPFLSQYGSLSITTWLLYLS